MTDAQVTDAQVTDAEALDRARCIRWMLIGAFVGIFAPIAGFLGGSTVSADRLVAGLEPLFVWLFVGMMVGGIGVVIGVIGALRWVKGKYHLE